MDTVLGVECESAAISYVIVQGSAADFRIVDNATIKAPSNQSRSEILVWAYNEIEELLRRFVPAGVGFKKTELGSPARAASLERAEVEGVARLAVLRNGHSAESWPWKSLSARLKTRNREGTVSTFASDERTAVVTKSRAGSLAAALVSLRDLA